MVIIVPSRALINEYFIRISNEIPDKSINVLTFIDRINTKYAKRNIFIVTPERCKELFKHIPPFEIDFFLFDEAQLSDENSTRGLYFDSIIRRIQRMYPQSKFVFAHPFVENPQAQIIKNKFNADTSCSFQFVQKNVGQMFYVEENNVFSHFGIDKKIMGKQKVRCKFDPILKVIKNCGSVLVYTTKASIYNKTVFKNFEQYIDKCKYIKDKEAQKLITEIKNFLGASDTSGSEHFSNMIYMLKRGIVVHHGSLPLQARVLLEKFTQMGYCRICFATSTLEQGINMPFDIVYLNTFQASKPLALKNLIGRAGRSSEDKKFDYGSIIIKKANMATFRDILSTDETLKEVSMLDDEGIDIDYIEFKNAILNNTISDEYNLSESQLDKLTTKEVFDLIGELLDNMFSEGKLLPLSIINKDSDSKLEFYKKFEILYASYLGRDLSDGEKNVLNTAIRILLWRIHCKTFKEICYYRYSYASMLHERNQLKRDIETAVGFEKLNYTHKLNNLYAAFVTGYSEIPNKSLLSYSMFGNRNVKAIDVDYDRIVFDTYDYLDKIIGFQLSDIFYAAFHKYYIATKDVRAEQFAKYLKYGTDNTEEIWLLRYGFTFEDIEQIKPYIKTINQEEIVFNDSVVELQKEKQEGISRFIHT